MTVPTQARGEATRTAILKAARNLFLSQGYHGTSVRQIATAAGIVPGAVYNHFASKEAIHLALLRESNIYSTVARALEQAEGDTADDLLRDGAHRLVEALHAHDQTVRLLFVDVLEFEGRNIATLAAAAVPQLLGFFARVTALAHDGRSLKPIRPDVMARAFLGLFMSYFMIGRFYRSLESTFPALAVDDGIVDHFLEIYLHGVMANPQAGAGSVE